jgi:hypothetical protein
MENQFINRKAITWKFLWDVAARPRISIPHSRSASRWMHSLELLTDRFRYGRAYMPICLVAIARRWHYEN